MLGEQRVIEVRWKSCPQGSWESSVDESLSTFSSLISRLLLGSYVYASVEDTFKDERIFAIFKNLYAPWLQKIVAGPDHYLTLQMSLLEIKLEVLALTLLNFAWNGFQPFIRAFKISLLRSFGSQREYKISILAK